jgi:outer membrane murein-binding lipoprotein Lpp
MKVCGRAVVAAVVSAVVATLLAGCSGTVKIDPAQQARLAQHQPVAGVSAIQVELTEDVKAKMAGVASFDRDMVGKLLRNRLESEGLVADGSAHRVRVLLNDVRVRSALSAIMLGVLAGDDHITGKVQLLDAQGRAKASFDVSASYAFGGIAGGQDGARMGWLYEKFAELSVTELRKWVGKAGAPVAVAASVPAAATSTPGADIAASGQFAALDDVEAIPNIGPGCRKWYREEYLTRGAPRAFVISDSTWCYGTYGNKPKVADDPVDVAERALKHCNAAGRKNCTLYALNDKVLYNPAK